MGWIRLGRSFYPQLGICHVHSGCSGQQGSGTPQVRTTNSTTAYCKPIWREVNVISLHNWDKQSVILFCIVDVVTPVQLFTLRLSKAIMTAVLREVFLYLYYFFIHVCRIFGLMLQVVPHEVWRLPKIKKSSVAFYLLKLSLFAVLQTKLAPESYHARGTSTVLLYFYKRLGKGNIRLHFMLWNYFIHQHRMKLWVYKIGSCLNKFVPRQREHL